MKNTSKKLLNTTNPNKTKILKSVSKIILVILCTISSFLALRAIKQPLTKETISTINTIEEKHTFDYSILVKRSKLYPDGGIVKPDKVIFTNITDELIIQLDSTISSLETVKIEADTEVLCRIIAQDMWEREIELIPKRSQTIEGNSATILDEEIRIKFKEIYEKLDIIEEETLVRPSSYQIVITPLIKGSVLNETGTVIHDINKEISIPFDLSGQYIKYAGESPDKEFINFSKIEDKEVISQKFAFLGIKTNVIVARLIFSVISIFTLILLFKNVALKAGRKRQIVSEVDIIDGKLRKRIIEVSDKISFNMLPQLGLKSINFLVQIADEKDEPVLKYSDGDMVFYYVLGGASVYYYCIDKNMVKG